VISFSCLAVALGLNRSGFGCPLFTVHCTLAT
jgi:hypothetical protein